MRKLKKFILSRKVLYCFKGTWLSKIKSSETTKCTIKGTKLIKTTFFWSQEREWSLELMEFYLNKKLKALPLKGTNQGKQVMTSLQK